MKHLVLFLALGTLVVLPSAVAQNCPSGFDQFQTQSGTTFNLGAGIGNVSFQGVPIQASSGNADTIIQRTTNPQNSGQCSIQVYALFMKSTSPITLNGQSVDVYATINNTGGAVSTSVLPQPDAASQTPGSLTVTSSGSSGGTFNSSLPVTPDLIFVKAGASVTNPANYVAHQVGPVKTLVGVQVQFFTNPPPNYPGCLPANVFYVYQINGSTHPHLVLAAVVQCNGVAGAERQTAAGVASQPACVCLSTTPITPTIGPAQHGQQ